MKRLTTVVGYCTLFIVISFYCSAQVTVLNESFDVDLFGGNVTAGSVFLRISIVTKVTLEMTEKPLVILIV